MRREVEQYICESVYGHGDEHVAHRRGTSVWFTTLPCARGASLILKYWFIKT